MKVQSLSSDCKVKFWKTVLDFSQLDFVHLQLFEQNPPLLLFFLYIPGSLSLVHVGSPLPFPVNITETPHSSSGFSLLVPIVLTSTAAGALTGCHKRKHEDNVNLLQM